MAEPADTTAKRAEAQQSQSSKQAAAHEPENFQPHEKPASTWMSADDWRLLVITFAGTVAANLVTVLLVGLALALVHEQSKSGGGPDRVPLALTSAGVSLLIGLAAVLFGRYGKLAKLAKQYPKWRTGRRIFYAVTLGFAGVYFLASMFTFIGLASGIK
jgi:hypothetical protein